MKVVVTLMVLSMGACGGIEDVADVTQEAKALAATTDDDKFEICLKNATIASIHRESLDNDAAANKHDVREHLPLTYQKITRTWCEGGLAAEDDWQQD